MQDKEIWLEGFRGCVTIYQKGHTLLEWTGGYADLANLVPNTLETRFATASAGKIFVAVGILQMMERGELALSDTLGRLIDRDWHAIDRNVTVEQLLTHTAGVPDYFDESVMDDYEELWRDYPNYKIRRNADLLPLFIDKPMLYPRGSRFQYNNSGYVLLAMILEEITGQPFDMYLKTHIFDKCCMEATGYYALDRLPAHCANHYIPAGDEGWRTNIFSVDVKGTGAGGAYTTVGDIRRFWEKLMDGTLLKKETVRSMLEIHSGDGLDEEEGYYGYGVWLIKNGVSIIPYFQGCDPGVSFMSAYCRENDTISVAVSNYGDNVWQVMRNIRAAYF